MTALTPPPGGHADGPLAVYVDLENVVWCHYASVMGAEAAGTARRTQRYDMRSACVDVPAVLDRLRRRWGDVGVLRAFGNPNNPALRGYQEMLRACGADIVITRPTGGLKNGADIRMVIAAMDDLSVAPMSGVVLVAGDSDFAPLVERLQRDGLKVFGVAAHSGMGFTLKKLFDDFEYIEVPRLAASDLGKELRAYAEGAIIVALERSGKSNPPQPLGAMKSAVNRRIKGFSPQLLTFGSWEEFIATISGVEVIGRGRDAQVRRGAGPAQAPKAKSHPAGSAEAPEREREVARRLRSMLATLAACDVDSIDGGTFIEWCRSLDASPRHWSEWVKQQGLPLLDNKVSTSLGGDSALSVDAIVRAGLAAKPSRALGVLLAVEAHRDPAEGIYVTKPLPRWSTLSGEERQAEVSSRVEAMRRQLGPAAMDAERIAAALVGDEGLPEVRDLILSALASS